MMEKEIIVDNLKIHYFQSDNFNKNEVVVFLHGWSSEALHLKTIFANLENYIALDLPGFGKSDLPREAWSVTEYAECLRKFLMKLEIENPILVGHSFGGSIIVKYLSDGGTVKKSILLGAAGIRKTGLRIEIYQIMAKVIGPILKLPGLNFFRDKIREKMYKLIDSEDYMQAGALKESYQKIIREDLSEDMQHIQTRVILIWGKNDTATPLYYGQRMQRLIQGSKLYVIESAGHFSFIDQPSEFKKIFLHELNVA